VSGSGSAGDGRAHPERKIVWNEESSCTDLVRCYNKRAGREDPHRFTPTEFEMPVPTSLLDSLFHAFDVCENLPMTKETVERSIQIWTMITEMVGFEPDDLFNEWIWRGRPSGMVSQ